MAITSGIPQEDVSASLRAPEDQPEKSRELKTPDDFAAWVIGLMHAFDERQCQDLRARAREAFAQYNGQQWEPAVKGELRAAKRPCLTFNEIRPKIDALIGEERRNREDWIAKPREGSDDAEAEVRTALLKYVREVNELQIDESRAWEDLAVGGFGGLAASLVPSPEGDAPLMRIQYRNWKELRWDPNSRARDYSDAQWMALSVMASVDRLKELFPDYEQDIMLEWQSLRSDPEMPDVDTGERPGVSRYIDSEMRPSLYDANEGQIRAIEFYYRTRRVLKFVHLRTQQGIIVRDVTDADPLLMAQLVALTQQGVAAIQERPMSAIRGALVVGRKTLTSWWSPFQGTNAFGDPMFPIFIAMASDTDGYIMGLVEPMIDAQAEINKRWSMTVDNYLKQGRSGGVYEDGAFENEVEVKKRWGETGYWAKARKGAIAQNAFKANVPPPTDQALVGLFQMAQLAMDRVSNIEKARLGLTSQETSGIAIRTRALQSALVQVKAFDNFRHMQLLLGKFVNANLHLMFPTTKTLRLTLPTGQTQNVTLNEPRLVEGAWKVANSTSGNQFDITMDLTPANATFREMQAQNFANLLGQIGPPLKEIPAFFPAYLKMLSGLIRMIDGLPNREEIIQELDAGIQRFLQPKPPAEPEPPKVSVSLRGDLSPNTAADLADGQLSQPPEPAPPEGAPGMPPAPMMPSIPNRPMGPMPLNRPPAPVAGLPFIPGPVSVPGAPGRPVTAPGMMARPNFGGV